MEWGLYRGINSGRQYMFTEIYRKETLVRNESLEEKAVWEVNVGSASLTCPQKGGGVLPKPPEEQFPLTDRILLWRWMPSDRCLQARCRKILKQLSFLCFDSMLK